MAENKENDIPTDGSGVFSRDPAVSDIVKSLAEKLGISPEKACELCGLKRPEPKPSEDDEDQDENDEQSCPGVFVHWLPDPEPSEEDEYDDEDEDDEDEDFSTGDGYLKDNHSDEYYQKRYDVSGRFEIHNENLYWAKRGKDNSEWTITFMVDDFKIEDEAYFSIVAKLSNVTWTGAGEIENYTIDNIGVDEDDIEWAPSDEVVNRLVEDAKKLIKHLSIDSDGEVDLDW